MSLVALYYFFLYASYVLITNVTYVTSIIPETFDPTHITIKIGHLLCTINQALCFESLKHLPPVTLPLPKRIADFVPLLRNSMLYLIITPLVISLLICLTQILLLIRECKYHLIQIYKDECEYVQKPKNYHNYTIIANSAHFSGYMVGYTIWGYLTIYIFLVIIGILILSIRLFIGDQFFFDMALKLVPPLTVFLFHLLVYFLGAKLSFTLKTSKILALNNFRAFNIFLYFNFYFDCFMGFISSIVRLIKAITAAIFFMPSKKKSKIFVVISIIIYFSILF